MYKPTYCFAVVTACLCATSASIAVAQFGGLQDLQLQRQHQQNLQNSANPFPSQPTVPTTPHSGNYHRPDVGNNYYIQVPGYQPYGYYNPYQSVNPYGHNPYGNGYNYNQGYSSGYGNYYGNPYQSGQYNYPPAVGVPYGPGQYGNFANPPVAAAGPIAPQAQAPQPVQPPNGPPKTEDEIKRRVAALKPSTDAGRLQSDELIADGDREFAAQQYRKAAATYRQAISKAPDYPPGHLRSGHAYLATGDYELAVTYFAMGFELSRTIQRPDFSLEGLYKGDRAAKEQHQEALADAVLRQPNDGGLLFLTGLFQHYDGHPLQARDYFRRAASMSGRHQPYAAMFVPK